MVAPGLYEENINVGGKAISVLSEGRPAVTIIDGSNADTVVRFSYYDGTGFTLSGFTVRNGRADYQEGGGITIEWASPTVIGNWVVKSKVCNGAGIGVQFGSPIIRGHIIRDYDGVTTCLGGGNGGGGIHLGAAGSTQVVGNNIANNTSMHRGGGLSLFAAGAPIIVGNRIAYNRVIEPSLGAGGAMHLVNQSDALIAQNLISGNQASVGGGTASAVDRGPHVLNNTIVFNNSQLGSGSAIYADGSGFETLVINNILVGLPSQTAFHCGPAGT